MKSGLLIFAALSLTACPRRDPATPAAALPAPALGPRVALPDGGVHHTERLAWTAWRADGAFAACGRRTADFTVAGTLRGCVIVERPGGSPAPLDWSGDPAFRRESAPVDAAPGGCRVLLDDVPGDPGAPAARATLQGPSGATVLDAWKPPPAVDGDYFAIETSFSPDGRLLAVIHTAIGLGPDERTVDVAGIELRPAPACP
ncbi:MAG: hypothetical protein EXR72_18855 [Myxococcales bacterium]|nr:hypothetical protein [Myxococcales bacterium]